MGLCESQDKILLWARKLTNTGKVANGPRCFRFFTSLSSLPVCLAPLATYLSAWDCGSKHTGSSSSSSPSSHDTQTFTISFLSICVTHNKEQAHFYFLHYSGPKQILNQNLPVVLDNSPLRLLRFRANSSRSPLAVVGRFLLIVGMCNFLKCVPLTTNLFLLLLFLSILFRSV